MLEMSVDSVRINLATQQRVVILKALTQDRYLFIWIAHAEAYAIAVHLQGTHSPRPLTHDLLKNLLEKIGTRVIQIVISDYSDEVFYAQIVLDVAGQHMQIDARPSDAIALAVRTSSPIFVADQIMGQCGVYKEQNNENASSSEVEKEEEHKLATVDAHEDTAPSELSTLKLRLAQMENELREAQRRIAELEVK